VHDKQRAALCVRGAAGGGGERGKEGFLSSDHICTRTAHPTGDLFPAHLWFSVGMANMPVDRARREVMRGPRRALAARFAVPGPLPFTCSPSDFLVAEAAPGPGLSSRITLCFSLPRAMVAASPSDGSNVPSTNRFVKAAATARVPAAWPPPCPPMGGCSGGTEACARTAAESDPYKPADDRCCRERPSGPGGGAWEGVAILQQEHANGHVWRGDKGQKDGKGVKRRREAPSSKRTYPLEALRQAPCSHPRATCLQYVPGGNGLASRPVHTLLGAEGSLANINAYVLLLCPPTALMLLLSPPLTAQMLLTLPPPLRPSRRRQKGDVLSGTAWLL